MNAQHDHYMHTALSVARKNLGQTWPNPSVGAVIVKDDAIIAEACTARGGRPHAETQAIELAGEQTYGATLYVTLEPCSHHGKTPPCVDAVIKAGFAKVVIACSDPNPSVNGKGIAALRQAGIEVIENICQREAEELNRGFISVIKKGRPFISLKVATSLDGKIATSAGQSQWITGDQARKYGHTLRSQYDAIATGIGTVLADNPLLTCRTPGKEDKSPVRVVFDSTLRLPADSQIAMGAHLLPVWAICNETSKNNALADKGVELLPCPGQKNTDGRPDINAAVQILTERGITRLLVEAGTGLSTAFLQSGLVDRMYWFRAPLVIGNEGQSAFGSGFAAALSDAIRFTPIDHVALAPDCLDILECLPAS